jgi:hypothetical protein|tara:strand:+ start:10018 stop:10242 length:225 start_codon:yes stop_codon:yes gene_type:complete
LDTPLSRKKFARSVIMELKPEDRNLRDSLKREIQRLEPTALLDDAPPEIKQQYREAQAAMKVLIGKLQAEGVDI